MGVLGGVEVVGLVLRPPRPFSTLVNGSSRRVTGRGTTGTGVLLVFSASLLAPNKVAGLVSWYQNTAVSGPCVSTLGVWRGLFMHGSLTGSGVLFQL